MVRGGSVMFGTTRDLQSGSASFSYNHALIQNAEVFSIQFCITLIKILKFQGNISLDFSVNIGACGT